MVQQGHKKFHELDIKMGYFSTLLSRLWGYNKISNVLLRLRNDKEMQILILGISDAGKTTILYQMKVNQFN